MRTSYNVHDCSQATIGAPRGNLRLNGPPYWTVDIDLKGSPAGEDVLITLFNDKPIELRTPPAPPPSVAAVLDSMAGIAEECRVRDVLMDIQHYCAMRNIDFQSLVSTSERCFKEECE